MGSQRSAAAKAKLVALGAAAACKQVAVEKNYLQIQSSRAAHFARVADKQQAVMSNLQLRREADAAKLLELMINRLCAAETRRKEFEDMKVNRAVRCGPAGSNIAVSCK